MQYSLLYEQFLKIKIRSRKLDFFKLRIACCLLLFCPRLLGSVAEGRGLLSQDQNTVVTGAPKANKDDAKGSVILTVKKKSTSGDGDQLKPYLTLRGEQMGSYFGNSLAVADLNNDGYSVDYNFVLLTPLNPHGT